MIWPNRLRIVFKTISALLAGIFLWNQIAWAGDLYLTIDEFNEDVEKYRITEYSFEKNRK